MVLLGKEQPIGLETQEVFNPTTVNMVLQAQQNYVNAMREDYIRQQEEMKQFKKEYGDFYSPISKDNQLWYAATQQPIKELMEKYGPNLMRSQEGRAMIANTLNNVDYGLLSRLKASAANALQYQKVLMELKAKGEYSDEYQHWLNKQRGVSDFENWDTANDGVFAASSPDIYKDLNSVTHSWYDNAERLYKGMEGGNRVYALDMNDLKNIAQTNAQGFVKTPRGAYEMYQIKNQLKQAYPQLSEDQLNTKAGELLNERVAQANIEQLKAKKYEADPFALQRYKSQLDEGAQRRMYALQHGDQQKQGMLQYSDRFMYNANKSFIDKTLNGANMVKSMLNIQKYWANRVQQAKTEKAKKEALAHLKWWKGSEKWSPEQLVKNGIIKVGNNGIITPTDRFVNAYMYSNSTNAKRVHGSGSYCQQLMKNAKDLYDTLSVPVTSGNKEEHSMWMDIMANNNELTTMPGTSNKYRRVTLNDRSLRYAPLRHANVTGTMTYKYDTLQRRFDRWLRSNGSGDGYLVRSDISTAMIPKKEMTGMMTDVSGNVSITSSQFNRFCEKYGYKNHRDVAAKLGLGIYDYKSKVSKNSDSSEYTNTYYTIPMIRTVQNNGGFFWRDLNNRMNKSEFGSNNAYGETINAEASSLMRQ